MLHVGGHAQASLNGKPFCGEIFVYVVAFGENGNLNDSEIENSDNYLCINKLNKTALKLGVNILKLKWTEWLLSKTLVLIVRLGESRCQPQSNIKYFLIYIQIHSNNYLN